MNLHDSCFIFMQESVKINKQDLDNILDGFLPRTCKGLLVGSIYLSYRLIMEVKSGESEITRDVATTGEAAEGEEVSKKTHG